MARLFLKFEQAVLKEYPLSQAPVTIGRLPDNVVQIDNLAVSGHHARIIHEAGSYVVEDNNSLNGTYVNNARVSRAALKDGDSILIGKHVLAFEAATTPAESPSAHAAPAMSSLDATVVMSRKPAGGAMPGFSAPQRDRVGLLNVLAGKTDESQYALTGKLTVIGKSDMASIRLRGWFAPKVAANVMKRDGKYFIAASEKDVRVIVNGESISGQCELADGDNIEVAGLTFNFTYQE